MQRRFHSYSANNVLLIRLQCPDATRVAGFRRWLELGRHVRKGEKGIAILAPIVRRAKVVDEDTGEERIVVGTPSNFRVAHVFDVSQTDGDELPEHPAQRLRGDDPDGSDERLVAVARGIGFSVEEDFLPGGTNAVCRFGSKTITVDPSNDPIQMVKTLAHELRHRSCTTRPTATSAVASSPSSRPRASPSRSATAWGWTPARTASVTSLPGPVGKKRQCAASPRARSESPGPHGRSSRPSTRRRCPLLWRPRNERGRRWRRRLSWIYLADVPALGILLWAPEANSHGGWALAFPFLALWALVGRLRLRLWRLRRRARREERLRRAQRLDLRQVRDRRLRLTSLSHAVVEGGIATGWPLGLVPLVQCLGAWASDKPATPALGGLSESHGAPGRHPGR